MEKNAGRYRASIVRLVVVEPVNAVGSLGGSLGGLELVRGCAPPIRCTQFLQDLSTAAREAITCCSTSSQRGHHLLQYKQPERLSLVAVQAA